MGEWILHKYVYYIYIKLFIVNNIIKIEINCYQKEGFTFDPCIKIYEKGTFTLLNGSNNGSGYW